MIREYGFDEVHDCQETFRLLLHAISNPGEIVDIGKYAGKLEEDKKVMLALALTLLDKETSFAVINDGLFGKTAADITYSRLTEAEADFIFVPGECSPEVIGNIFSGASPGTIEEPHAGSALIICIDEFSRQTPCLLKGPGINGTKRAVFSEYARRWIWQRDAMEYEYPAGIDIFFVTNRGELMAIPRKVSMEG